ncbi:hypothetical protein L0U88_07215 [Flavihumibacter sp. RY-1]|uniref:Uncharacterized protein n=1 Tax=Flavihumibacter fluminis TaxID=2909236 RepID=A0ABS9BH75_9BACT|nr:hypothetical protein [Flavihumibacter fluminis]MCF1714413.1 hypothetical protein [Flavihumibacter fluminis]
MALDKEIKKKVFEDWQNAFPQLSNYTQEKFYKVVGPIIIGLELIKLSRTEEYRPHFVVYSLFGNKMGNDIKACLAGPIVLQEYTNNKGFQFEIPYTKHSNFFNDVIESIKKQTPLSFDGNISLKNILSMVDEYSKKPPLNASPNSYLQAALLEAKLKIALYVSAADAQNVFDEIKKIDWDTKHFKACGVSVNDWIESMWKTINNRDEFLKQIEKNKQDKKISSLKCSEIIN